MPVPASSILPTVDDLKARVNITSATHDTELTDMLEAAADVVEGHVGKLDERSVTETHYFARSPILLRETPTLSVTSVEDGDGNLYDSSGYTFNATTGQLWLGRSGWSAGFWWGQGVRDVTVTYTVGRATIPAAVREAILLVAARLWETQRGTAPSALPVEEAFEPDQAGAPAMTRRVRELLEPYMLSRL